MFEVKRTFMKTQPDSMRHITLRISAKDLASADKLGQFVRGGRSEVLRCAIVRGLPKLSFFARRAMKSSQLQ
jgi:hypothetical protein